MTAESFEEDDRVLTPKSFDLVLSHEVKRAVRTQNLLTLVVMEAALGQPHAEGEPARALARVVAEEVRETDLLSRLGDTRVTLVLFDADISGSMRVIDRLAARLEHYVFAQPLSIAIGAACCPTDATDPESLHREAAARQLLTRRTADTSNL